MLTAQKDPPISTPPTKINHTPTFPVQAVLTTKNIQAWARQSILTNSFVNKTCRIHWSVNI